MLDVINKILIAMAVVALALIGRSALAADLELAPRAPVAVAVAYPSWSGPYIGIGLGTRLNAVDANTTSATVGIPPVPIGLPIAASGDPNALAFWQQQQGAQQYMDHISLRGGLYAGWNFQVAPAFVLGVEGDIAYANETATFHGSPYPANLLFGTPAALPLGASPSDSLRLTTRWDGSLRVRGGWLPTPSVLLYLTAGLAFANIEASSVCSTFHTPNVLNCAGACSHHALGDQPGLDGRYRRGCAARLALGRTGGVSLLRFRISLGQRRRLYLYGCAGVRRLRLRGEQPAHGLV